MSSKKHDALRAIEGLSEDATYDDIIERILFIQKVEAGLDDVREGRVMTNEEVKRRLAEWLK